MSRGTEQMNESTAHVFWAAAMLTNQGGQVDIGE